MRLFRTAAVVGAAALTLAACTSADDASTDPEGDLAGSGTGEDCTIDSPVPVGAVLSLTGAAASYGETQRNGLELAAEELNAQGGVTYELSVEDDETDPKQGITVFEQFTGSSPQSIIIGPTLSNAAKQTDPIAQDAGTPVLGISNTAEGITELGDYIFRDSLTEAAVIPETVKAATAAYGLQKVVVMYSNDDAFTESGYDAFAGALEDEGVEISETITFSKSDTEFRALLEQANSSQPDALVVSALIEAAVPLVTQAREAGMEMPIIGGNGFNTPQLMADAGDAAEGVIVGAAWNSASDDPLTTGFKQAYEEANGGAPDQFAAQAYAGMYLVDAAVRAGCSGERDAIKENLAELSGVPTVLGEFSFTDGRDADHPAVVQVVENGAFAVLE